jgi:hypothetical protein
MATRMQEQEVGGDFEALKREVDQRGAIIITREGRAAKDDLILMTVDRFFELVAPNPAVRDLFFAAALDRGGGG